MDSSITAQCFVERETGLILDMVGNGLQVGSVIMCKLTPFVIMKDGDINYMGGIPYLYVSHGSVVVSKHGLNVGSLGSIPTAITTMTSAGGDPKHVSLNH